jgi:hypothetical protein
VRLHRGAPQLEALVLAPLGEELGDVAVLLVRGRGRQRVAVLGLERLLGLGVVEQVLAVEVDLDEGLHRHAEEVVALGRILEVVDEAGEGALVEVRRLERGVVGQRLGDVDEEVAGQVAVDDVLLDIDEVIDAGIGIHVLDRLVVHLVPGRRLELDLDAGRLGEGRSQHVLDVVRRRRALADAADGDALIGLGGIGPEVRMRE